MSKNDNVFNEHGYKISTLEGKMLTQLEASLPNGQQLTALKSVTRSLIWDWFYKEFGTQVERDAIYRESEVINTVVTPTA